MSMQLLVNPDGADFQSQAVLAMVRDILGEGIADSWDPVSKRYLAEPTLTHYYDGHQITGYAIALISQQFSQRLNIVFHQAYSSDDIAVFAFELVKRGPVQADDIPEGLEPWFFKRHDIMGVAKTITELLNAFWTRTKPSPGA